MPQQTKSRSLETWHSLNERQQTYMRCIYDQDQAQERNERQRSALNRSRPAEEWRRITYGDTIYGHTPLKQAIKDADMVDQGTGSTFKALTDRGFIRTESEHATLHPRSELIVHVWITIQGRKLVRDVLQLTAPTKLAVGTLREWHWRALAQAYAAGCEGVSREGLGYARIGWNTWLRLRDYQIKGTEYPLIEEAGGIHITDFGIAYYERSYQRYRELYPGVEAVSPAQPVDPQVPYVQELQDTRHCRVCLGAHLVAVTRTYQQDRKWIWTVQEQEHRIPGDATSRYLTSIEQCRCREQDIQEISLPFMELLDQLLEQNWHVRFPRNHWIRYLEYLVSGSSEGRAFYDPGLTKHKLLPLLEQTDKEEDLNIAREEIRYCFNEHAGRGCVYVPTSGPFAKVPVMVTCRSEGNEE